jgi:hypothetical protein
MNIAKLNRSALVERLAQSVLKTLGYAVLPIDVVGIARAEGILLAEGDYGSHFFGRIEYHAAVRRFILYHPILSPNARDYWQTRFSIAHELGHYYIPEHRELLISGKGHSSESGFICDNNMEREADLFASALLIPDGIAQQLWSSNAISLQRILRVSALCETSAISAGIRGAKGSEETAVVVLSRHSKVLFASASDEAGARRLGWVNAIPADSPSAKVAVEVEKNKILEASVSIQSWYPDAREQVSCWEEAIRLGNTDFVLTLLVVEDEEDED